MLMAGLSAAVVVGMLAAPLAQRAPTIEEQNAFSEGLRLYGAGDARGAERAWKAGYAAGHDPAFLVRIGEAQEKAGAPEEAVRSYGQYLREAPDAVDRPDIELRVRRLAPPSGGKADGDSPQAQDQDKHDDRQDDRQDDLKPLVEDEMPRSRLNTAAWITTGVATVLLGVAAFFGASAADKSGEANRLLTYADPDTQVPREYADVAREYEANVRDGQRDDRFAKGLAACAGVTVLAAVVLFVIDGTTEKAAPQVQVRADPSGTRTPAVALRGAAGLASGLGVSWSF